VAGLFIAVVGPSGVGKDTLLDHARALYARDPRFLFPRRVITRDALLGGEIFDSVSTAKFDSMERAGGFALSWCAYGLAYGIRQEVGAELRSGKCVVVNVSRAILDQLQPKFGRAHVVHVTAAPEIVATRLAARGRETQEEIRRRVARYHEQIPAGIAVTTLDNGRTLDVSRLDFVSLLNHLADPVQVSPQIAPA